LTAGRFDLLSDGNPVIFNIDKEANLFSLRGRFLALSLLF
jgi:hypothetical protein